MILRLVVQPRSFIWSINVKNFHSKIIVDLKTTRDVVYKVGAEWTPENPDIIVSHGTPGVGATGVGVGQSITGQDPQGQFSQMKQP